MVDFTEEKCGFWFQFGIHDKIENVYQYVASTLKTENGTCKHVKLCFYKTVSYR